MGTLGTATERGDAQNTGGCTPTTGLREKKPRYSRNIKFSPKNVVAESFVTNLGERFIFIRFYSSCVLHSTHLLSASFPRNNMASFLLGPSPFTQRWLLFPENMSKYPLRVFEHIPGPMEMRPKVAR